MSDLKERILKAVQPDLDAIETALAKNLNPHLDLVRDVAGHILFSGGKRLRPLLMVLSARLCEYRGDYDKTFSTALEYLHAATLLHDVLVDGASLRRNQPAAHLKWALLEGLMRMTGYNEAFQDIPGTVVFDATQSRLGYHLNQFCMSLMKAENRTAFKAGERAYLERWPMTEEQRQAVLDRDYNRMISLGGTIYFLAKIGATNGCSFQNLASKMTGMTEEDYRAMMIAGGRSPEGNRSLAERDRGAAERKRGGR